MREVLQPIDEFKTKQGVIQPETLCKRVQQVAWENMLVAKDEPSLKTVLETPDSVNHELIERMGVANAIELVEALELRNLLVVGEIVAKAALTRTESRGNHFRKDFPQRDDARWLKVVTVKNVNGRIEVGTLAIDPEWRDRAGDMGTLHWG